MLIAKSFPAKTEVRMSEEQKEKLGPEEVTVTINNVELRVPKGELMVEAAKRLGIDIPIFCYHPRMSPVGMCRMCLVEIGSKQPDGSVRMNPKPQTACTLPASEGMIMFTDTEQIIKDRKGIIEFLLINHPLDCPVCDRGGECPLQNNTLFYGPGKSRYIEDKRHLVKAFPLSDYVVLDRERCIQCARCTRFTEEISGDGQLAFNFRGANTMVSSFEDTRFTSFFSGNVIEICPVGALTSRTYRFRARPWDILKRKTLCSLCSNGCNVWFDVRLNKLMRINGRVNEAVNEEWTCDRGKFHSYYVNSDKRLTQPLIRKASGLEPATWPEAYDLILNKFMEAVNAAGPNAIAGLGGERTTNEDNWMFQKFFRAGFGSNNLDHRMHRNQLSILDGMYVKLGVPSTQNSIESLEKAKAIFVLGSELITEQPIIYLRARKAWLRHGARVITANPIPTASEHFSEVSMQYKLGEEDALVRGLLHQLLNGVMPEERLSNVGELRKEMSEYTAEWTKKEAGISPDELQHAAKILAESDGAVILAGAGVQDNPHIKQLLDDLIKLTTVVGNKNGGLNLMLPSCNSHGAMDMGLLPDALPGYKAVRDDHSRQAFDTLWDTTILNEQGLGMQGIFEATMAGLTRCLYLVGCNPLTRYYDIDLAKRALEAAPFVVVQDIVENELMDYADVVLPAAAYSEKEGTFTNIERRVQKTEICVTSAPDVKPDWNIFAQLYLRLQAMQAKRPTPPPFSPREVMEEISKAVPQYQNCTYDLLGESGVRWEAST
ncbi:MAG: NADH-quinone oxidoreductase subunit NuoG [bacterium]